MSSIKENDTAVIAIVDPETKQPTGATITIAGPEHPKAKAIEFSELRRWQKAAQRANKLYVGDDPAVLAERAIDNLVAFTLDWSGFADDDGKPVPCTAENVRAWYIGLPWLRKQVQEARADAANFIVRSGTASSNTEGQRSA